MGTVVAAAAPQTRTRLMPSQSVTQPAGASGRPGGGSRGLPPMPCDLVAGQR